MKVCRMDCPYCGANIEADVENRKIVFCTYCGKQIQIKNDSRNITINQNININQNVNQRVTNDAEILKEQNRHRENRWVMVMASILLLMFVVGISVLFFKKNSDTAAETIANVDEEIEEKTEKEEHAEVQQVEGALVVQQEEEPVAVQQEEESVAVQQEEEPVAVQQEENPAEAQKEEEPTEAQKEESENQPMNDETAYDEESASLEKQPIELIESAYSVDSSSGSEYVEIHYAVKILNPNKEYAVRYPHIRITARSADGAILKTHEQRIRLQL